MLYLVLYYEYIYLVVLLIVRYSPHYSYVLLTSDILVLVHASTGAKVLMTISESARENLLSERLIEARRVGCWLECEQRPARGVQHGPCELRP